MERRGEYDRMRAESGTGAVGEKVHGSDGKKRASAGPADGAVEAGAAACSGRNAMRDGDDAYGAGGQHGAGRRISKKGAAGPSAAGSADAYGKADARTGERDGREHAVCDDGARPGIHY